MQAIVVKWLGPTTHKGSRFKATAAGRGRSVTVARLYNLSADENEEHAARALCERLGWAWNHVRGTLPDGNAVFVPVPHEEEK